MSEQLTLPAEARDRAGKGASRALRREGRVPQRMIRAYQVSELIIAAPRLEQGDVLEYDVVFRVMLDPEGNEFCVS